MSKITSEELRKLLDDATPGPWRVEEDTTLIWGDCNPDDTSSYAMGYPISECRTHPSSTLFKGPTEYEEYTSNAQIVALAPDLAAELLALREKHARQQKMAWKLVEALRFVRGWRDAQDMSHADYRIEVGKRAEAVLSEWEARNG
ncbi:hypothetical protein [Castellaniella sp.]|uniref:hypothetical protein n=1 Tax=Castellaniella sp. TaxID=1955812 RepID=UPI002B001640|nr:hypothetical protein [Castellaniella sp.]